MPNIVSCIHWRLTMGANSGGYNPLNNLSRGIHIAQTHPKNYEIDPQIGFMRNIGHHSFSWFHQHWGVKLKIWFRN